MAEANEKDLLALSKQVNELTSEKSTLTDSLNAKEQEIKALGESHQLELKEERERIREILELGKEHGKETLAFEAVTDGTDVSGFQKKLLSSYKSGNSTQDGDENMNLDASKEPKSRNEFLATYRSMREEQPGPATSYFNKYVTKFNK